MTTLLIRGRYEFGIREVRVDAIAERDEDSETIRLYNRKRRN